MKLFLFFSLLTLNFLTGQEAPNRFKKTTSTPERLETAIRSLTHLEFSKKTLQSWQSQNPGKALAFDQVQQWQEEGKARLINQSIITGLASSEKEYSHNQQVVKELIWPTELLPTNIESEWPMPTSFETKLLGLSWNVTFNFSQEETRGDQIWARYNTHLGYRIESPLVRKTHQESDTWSIPIFRHSSLGKSQKTLQFDDSKSIRIDSTSHPDNCIVVCSEVHKRELPAIQNGPTFSERSFTVSAYYLKVAHADWAAFSEGREMIDLIGESWPWAAKLVLQEKGSILYSPSIISRLQRNTTTQDIKLITYPTDYERPNNKEPLSPTNPLNPNSFDTRYVGHSLELEPSLHSSGNLLLRYSSYLTNYNGDSVVHRCLDDQKWIADAWMPRFSRISQNGIVALTPGQTTLVGASSALDDQGDPDPEYRILFYLKAE